MTSSNYKAVLITAGVGLGLLGLAWLANDAEGSGSGSGGGSGSGSGSGGGSGPGGTLTLEETAAQLREQYLTVSACDVQWSGPSAQQGLTSHVSDFFVPAVARARTGGAGTTDEASAFVAQLLVPGCPQPPAAIKLIPLDAALAGSLPVAQQTAFNLASSTGSVQLYLAVRSVVAAIMATLD